MSRARTSRVGIVLVIAGVILIAVLSNIGPGPVPLDLASSAPNGYKAIGLLLEEHGIRARSVPASSGQLGGARAGSVIFVPAPEFASERELRVFVAAARRGVTVIYGSAPPLTKSPSQQAQQPQGPVASGLENEALVNAPASLRAPGTCDIPELEGLGRIDTFVSSAVPLPLQKSPGLPGPTEVVHRCYGDDEVFGFVEVSAGDGRIIVMGSPHYWVNARLQPDRQHGGKVLDNGVTALRLLSPRGHGEDRGRVLFVKAVPSPGSISAGTKGVLELIPMSVKGLLIGFTMALGLFIWARATRLGQPVDEVSQVRVNSSELTAAIGRLFENDPDYLRTGARTLRAEATASIASAVGLPPNCGSEELCRAVAYRTGRAPAEVYSVIFGDPSVGDAAALVTLEQQIEQLRMEVGDVRSR